MYINCKTKVSYKTFYLANVLTVIRAPGAILNKELTGFIWKEIVYGNNLVKDLDKFSVDQRCVDVDTMVEMYDRFYLNCWTNMLH